MELIPYNVQCSGDGSHKVGPAFIIHVSLKWMTQEMCTDDAASYSTLFIIFK